MNKSSVVYVSSNYFTKSQFFVSVPSSWSLPDDLDFWVIFELSAVAAFSIMKKGRSFKVTLSWIPLVSYLSLTEDSEAMIEVGPNMSKVAGPHLSLEVNCLHCDILGYLVAVRTQVILWESYAKVQNFYFAIVHRTDDLLCHVFLTSLVTSSLIWMIAVGVRKL